MKYGNKEIEEHLDMLVRLLTERSRQIREEYSDPVVDVNERNFEELLRKHELVFLYFWAEWCGPCLVIKREYTNIAKRYADLEKVAFCRVNIDESMKLVDRLGVQHIPTLLVIYKGNIIDGLVGTVDTSVIHSKISSYIEEYIKSKQKH